MHASAEGMKASSNRLMKKHFLLSITVLEKAAELYIDP